MRIVDAAQYRQRLENFDFDVITQRLVMQLLSGRGIAGVVRHRKRPEFPGSRNLVGVTDPVVDALIAKALVAKSRDELVTICRALDRVLRAGHYWVPHWYKPTTGSRIGMCSAGRRVRRNSIRAFSPPGGTIRKRRPR